MSSGASTPATSRDGRHELSAPASTSLGSILALATVLVVIAALYAATLYPGVGGRTNVGDSAKFQFMGKILGVPHEPGFPQYLMANAVWVRVPLPGELATRVNALSALFALVAGVFLWLALAQLGAGPWIAAAATATVLLAPSVWSFSTEAEVYSLNLAWLSAVAWAALRWRRRPGHGRLLLLLLLYALSFGNHPMMITLAPGLVWLLLSTDRRSVLRMQIVGIAALFVALSFSQYLVLVILSQGDTPVLEGIPRDARVRDLVGTIRGQRFVSRNLLRKGWTELRSRWVRFPLESVAQIGPVAVLLALIGIGLLARQEPALAGFLALGIAIPMAWLSFYQLVDWSPYLAPCWLVAALAAAAGALQLSRRGLGVRVAVTAAWASSLLFSGAADAVALTVDPNRWDRSELLAAVPAGAGAVTYAGPGYRSVQLNSYYRHGLEVERTLGIELLTATRVFDEEWRFLDDRPLYFSDYEVRGYFERYHADFVCRRLTDSETEVCATGTSRPIELLEVRGRDQGGLEIVRDGTRLMPVEKSAVLAIIDPDRQRIQAILPIALESAPAPLLTGERFAELLAAVPAGKRLLLVADPAPTEPARSAMAELAVSMGLEAGLAEVPGAAFALYGRAGDPAALELYTDLPVTLVVTP